jgi:CBS domain-containing protein
MSRNIPVCSSADSITRLMHQMTVSHFRHVPVVDRSRLAGLISIGDVVKYRMDELEAEREHLVNYISSAG